MSDPVSNAEIEDVLSSIRRLVAGDRDETTISEPTEASETLDTPEPEEQDALVLTPSLRIEDERDQDPAVGADLEAEQWAADREAEQEAAGDVTGIDLPPDEEGAPIPIDSDSTVDGVHHMAISDEFVPIPDYVEPEVDPISDIVDDEADEDEALPTFIRPLRDLDSLVSLPEDPEREETELAVEETDAVSEELDSDERSDIVFTRNTPRAGFHFASLEEGDTNDTDGQSEAGYGLANEHESESLEASVEPDVAAEADTAPSEFDEPAVETVIGVEASCVAAEFQHLESGDTYSSLGDEDLIDGLEDPEDTPTIMEPDSSVSDEQGESGPLDNLFAAGAGSLDDAALRDLVAEMLHRELQGPLGERITRNVRKLVRREIHRALATRDFD